jgi:hypothetical protein
MGPSETLQQLGQTYCMNLKQGLLAAHPLQIIGTLTAEYIKSETIVVLIIALSLAWASPFSLKRKK